MSWVLPTPSLEFADRVSGPLWGICARDMRRTTWVPRPRRTPNSICLRGENLASAIVRPLGKLQIDVTDVRSICNGSRSVCPWTSWAPLEFRFASLGRLRGRSGAGRKGSFRPFRMYATHSLESQRFHFARLSRALAAARGCTCSGRVRRRSCAPECNLQARSVLLSLTAGERLICEGAASEHWSKAC
jgi:hypothetical protein